MGAQCPHSDFSSFLTSWHPCIQHVAYSVTPGGMTLSTEMCRAYLLLRHNAGGSCRIPAGMTGTVGFRPTTGCWNAGDGFVPMTVSRDTVGVSPSHTPAQSRMFWSHYKVHLL